MTIKKIFNVYKTSDKSVKSVVVIVSLLLFFNSHKHVILNGAFYNQSLPFSHLLKRNEWKKKKTWRRDAAKASCELFRRVLNWEQMLRASLAALRLSMASWATFRFHSGLMAGGLTNVILWMIYKKKNTHRETRWISERKTSQPPESLLVNECLRQRPVWFAPTRVVWQKILSERWPPRDRPRLTTVTNDGTKRKNQFNHSLMK